MHSITNTIRFGRSTNEKGTSKNFYGNAVRKSQAVLDLEELEEFSTSKSDPPIIDLYSDFDLEDDLDSASRAYRRQSLATRLSPYGALSETEITPPPTQPQDVIECTAVASSTLGSQMDLELVKELVSCDV